MDAIDRITAADVSPPGGHYSHGTAWRDLIFVSGQLPIRPDGTHSADAPFEQQVRQALENVMAVVRAAGSGPDRVLKVTAYIVGCEHWAVFNRIFAEIFEAKPARAVIPVPELHFGYLIEIEAIAVT